MGHGIKPGTGKSAEGDNGGRRTSRYITQEAATRTQLPKYRVQKLAGPTHSSRLAGFVASLWLGGWSAPGAACWGLLTVDAAVCALVAEAKSSEQATILILRGVILFSCATCHLTAHDVTIGSRSGIIKEVVRHADRPQQDRLTSAREGQTCFRLNSTPGAVAFRIATIT